MTITSAAPRANLTGINDLSRRVPPPVAEALPMHLPFVYLITERGPAAPQLVSGSDMTAMYGAKSFDYRQPFANHATVLANTVNARGNAIFVQRIIPTNASQAKARLVCEVVEADVPEYERNGDGTYRLDVSGAKIATGETIPGYKVRWLIEAMAANEDFNAAAPKAGSLLGRDGAVSTVYPIMEIPAHHFGAYGDNLGFRLSAPTTRSSVPVDEEVIEITEAYLYRLQVVERADANSSALVQQTLNGGQYVEFAFKDGVINKKVDTELSFNKIVDAAYTDTDTTGGFGPVYGSFGSINLYGDYVQTVVDLLHAAEDAATGGFELGPHAINMFGGVDYDGAPYQSFEVVGPSDGGILLTDSATHYLSGGSNGDMSFASFDQLVGEQIANFANSEFNLMDDAVYPFSAIYDSGFSIETKKKLLTPIGLRKDLYVVLSTQDASEPANTIEEDSSVAIALRSAARLYPESSLYGTSTCRAVIIGHAGKLAGSNYGGLVPATIDYADKVANFMGAGNGIARSGFGYDQSPLNQITMLKDVNNTYKSDRVRNKDWAAGLVWAQNYDRRSLFYPAFQTVYDDDTSVLNSALTMQIAVELEKVCQRVWRDLTGNSSLTNEQFIERSNRLIEKRTAGRFDQRVIIVPETYYTADDAVRGYSWSCNINMYANNMKTVGTFTVVARRREELE